MVDQPTTNAAVAAALSTRPVTVSIMLGALGLITSAVFQPLGGDLSGTVPSVTVTRIRGTPLPSAIVKGVSGVPTAATAGTDYLAPGGSGGGLTGITPSQVGAVNKTGDTMTGALTLPLFVMGVAQTAVGQIGQITSPYTTGMLNTQNDILRVQVGNVGPQFESGSQNPVTAGITSIIRTPAGAYSGGNTAGDAAIQAIAISDSNVNTGGNYKSGVAVDAIGGIGTSGAFVEAANTSIVNCSTFSNCTGNSGLNFTNFSNIEADTNLYCMTAFQNGVCPAAGMPTGPVFGVISQLNATTQNTSNLSAFRANGSPNLGGGTVPWKIAFDSLSGAATTGISLGAVSQANGSNSQNIQLVSISGAGAANFANIVNDNAGTLHFNPTNFDMGLTSTYPQLRLVNQTPTGGMSLSSTQTGAGASENIVFQTGSANSNATLGMVDGAQIALTSGAGLINGISLAATQGNITLAPPTGGAVKDSGNLLVAGHMAGNGTAPTLSASAGTPTLSAGANDNHGTITNGSTAGATVTLTFATARTNAPDCFMQSLGPSAGSITRSAPTTTNFQLTFSAAGGQASYICMGQ